MHGTKKGALPIAVEKRPCGKKVTLIANVTNPGALLHELKGRYEKNVRAKRMYWQPAEPRHACGALFESLRISNDTTLQPIAIFLNIIVVKPDLVSCVCLFSQFRNCEKRHDPVLSCAPA